MTGNGATTSTPESSEAPRENREGLGLLERFDATAALQMGEESRGTKVSSPELASLTAKYVNIENLDKHDVENVRSLAASVLAQAEGTPRK